MFHRKDRNCLDFHFIKFRVTTLKDYSHKFSITYCPWYILYLYLTISFLNNRNDSKIIFKIYIIVCIFYDEFFIIKKYSIFFQILISLLFLFFLHQIEYAWMIKKKEKKRKKRRDKVNQTKYLHVFISHRIITQKKFWKFDF